MMERIVGRDRLRGHPCPDAHDLVVRRLGNGHLEYSTRPVVLWEHVGVLSDLAYADRQAELEATAEERRQANLERAAKRAKTRVRLLCKASGVDTLLTLTYRANITDLDVVKVHIKAFNRKMARLIPSWAYVACFERQQRGAWHVHMAVHRLPRELPLRAGARVVGVGSPGTVRVKSFNVIRAVWRSVTGEAEGNIDVSRRKARADIAPGKMAAYLSKYMLKAFEDGDAWSNRFSSSRNIEVPRSERMRFVGYTFLDVIRAVSDDWPEVAGRQLSWGLNRWKDGLWVIIDLNAKPYLEWEIDKFIREAEHGR